ncbi:hypothetical protein ACWTQY_28510, partial [Klebsiella pneumoniae]
GANSAIFFLTMLLVASAVYMPNMLFKRLSVFWSESSLSGLSMLLIVASSKTTSDFFRFSINDFIWIAEAEGLSFRMS